MAEDAEFLKFVLEGALPTKSLESILSTVQEKEQVYKLPQTLHAISLSQRAFQSIQETNPSGLQTVLKEADQHQWKLNLIRNEHGHQLLAETLFPIIKQTCHNVLMKRAEFCYNSIANDMKLAQAAEPQLNLPELVYQNQAIALVFAPQVDMGVFVQLFHSAHANGVNTKLAFPLIELALTLRKWIFYSIKQRDISKLHEIFSCASVYNWDLMRITDDQGRNFASILRTEYSMVPFKFSKATKSFKENS